MTTALFALALALICALAAEIAQSVQKRRRRAFNGTLAEIRAACERAARQNPDWYHY